MASIYLGVDIGTTSAKCLAVDEAGEILALAQYPYGLERKHRTWVEQDPADYWYGLVDIVRRCVRNCEHNGYKKDDVAAMAISTQGGTLIITDKSGTPLAPAISWMDGRADVERNALLSEKDAAFWYSEVGNSLTAFTVACKVRWLARRAPWVWDVEHRLCFVPDYLARQLCGEFAIDVPSASWTSLYSPLKRQWSEEVLRVLESPLEVLSVPVESGTTIGELLPEVADQLGVGRKTKLVAGAFDQAAAGHGAGARADGRSVLSCGTAWVIYAVSSNPVSGGAQRLCICCHTKPGEWGLVLPFTGGSAYDWLNRTLADTETGKDSGAEPLIFIPHMYGGLSPDWHSESKGSILGLTLSHTPGDIRLAIMRGIAFEARRNLEAAEQFCGRSQSVRMVGGAGKSETWPRMIANILGRSVEVPECVESACYGAAKLAAGAISERWTGMEPKREFAPNAGDVQMENHLFEKYLRFYDALLPVYGDEA